MKTLLMPVQTRSRSILPPRAKAHFKALQFAASVTLAIFCALAATVVSASALALALGTILVVAAAAVAMVVFMLVSPEGNLLLLLLLSQLWLLYARRQGSPDRQPDGGLTMKVRSSVSAQQTYSLAA